MTALQVLEYNVVNRKKQEVAGWRGKPTVYLEICLRHNSFVAMFSLSFNLFIQKL